MKIFKNGESFVKENWKSMIFSIFYMLAFIITILFIGIINSTVKDGNSGRISELLLSIAVLSIFSIIMKDILNLVFKDKAIEVAKKSSVVLILIGAAVTIIVVAGLISKLGIPTFDTSSELGILTLMFILPMYFGLLIIITILFILVTFLAFGLLRLVIKYTKIITVVFLISTILYFVSLLDIFNIVSKQDTQKILQDIIEMEYGSYDLQNTYFIHNDMIYAYICGEKNYNDYGDEFFCIDFNGENKKIISNSEEMRMAQFIHISGDEAYYYTMYTNSIDKINLSTGEISIIHTFEEREGGRLQVHYEYAKQKFYEIMPQYKELSNSKYKIETNYKTISVTNIQNGKTDEYKEVVYYKLEDNILYIIFAKEINNIKLENIDVEKIVLE